MLEGKKIEDHILNKINKSLKPIIFKLANNSRKHQNHLLKNKSFSHFSLFIVSDKFNDMSLLKRHRLVYKLLFGLLSSKIHSLEIKAYTIKEYNKKKVR